jgi:hypothetical protein
VSGGVERERRRLRRRDAEGADYEEKLRECQERTLANAEAANERRR